VSEPNLPDTRPPDNPPPAVRPPGILPPELRDAYEVLAAGAAAILPADGLAERMAAAHREHRPLRVKLGIDPSGTSLTLGHAVVLRKLRQFQDAGHVAVLVVGGFTGQVGDPSGRTATRVAQSAETVMANATGYFEQLMRILDRDRCEVVDNAAWLSPMVLGDLLGYTRQVTVAQLLERDDFARRFKANEPITLSEFFYPLLQGIDSVEIRADIELGGTDQTFNNLVGRELQRSRGQAPQAVLTLPLLVGTDGVEKMGKSLGNFIAIDAPAAEQFGALMSIPDSVVGMYAQLCAGLHPRAVAELAAEAAAGGPGANQAKRAMARAVVGLYHGGLAAVQAEERFDAVFKRGEQPVDVPIHSLPAGDPLHLPALLVHAGLAESSSAARRLIVSGAVRIDGRVVRPDELDQARAGVDDAVLSVGKRKMVRLRS
jgi:tyrosyl-tRNA synthetase